MRQLSFLFLFSFSSALLLSACQEDDRPVYGEGDADADGDSDADADADAVGYYTSGSVIMTPSGQPAYFRGVNWPGFEDYRMSFVGLHRRSMDAFLDQLAGLGFNLIRLPFSNEMLSATVPVRNIIDYDLNPELQGLTPLQMLDVALEKIGQRGMKVILDRHRPSAGDQSKYWYTDEYPESQWISDWVMLAERYKGNPTVIGADLHNEPAGMVTWGWNDVDSDWNLAAERCGNAILAANSDWLIIVEGTEKNSGWDQGPYGSVYWMGGNLMGARSAPVNLAVPNKLVYSTHDYGPEIYDQPWMKDASYPANMEGVFDAYWGFIAKEGIAPVLVGEFGIKDPTNAHAVQWFNALTAYIAKHKLYWTYWNWTPDSDDTGGLLANDVSYELLEQGKLDLLSAIP